MLISNCSRPLFYHYSKDYQATHGAAKENVYGPDPRNVSGAAGKNKQARSKLACGESVDEAMYSGFVQKSLIETK